MKKIMIVDARENTLADVRMRMVLDDDRNIEIVSTLSTAANIRSAISAHKPDVVAVCENLIETQNDWEYPDIQVVGYAFTYEGNKTISKIGIPNYGVVKSATDLLDKLEAGVPKKVAPTPSPPRTQIPEPVAEPEPAKKDTSFVEELNLEMESDDHAEATPALGSNIKARLALYNNTERMKKITGELLDNDIYAPPKKTSVVTLYSAKGGVGKTTLATEIAVFLAITSHGRNNYRVCIVDYNIDFGDVQTTLDLSPDGPTMTWWAVDIRERIEAGEHPDDICYTRKEIESHLQTTKKLELYALLAPLTHEDSMDIGEAELQVMLRNIVDYGGFDFVICDTGNNTRDSSVTALEAAEFVLLVVTQDITAANCNDAVLTTLNKIHFDTSKIKLIINNVLPAKITGVAVQEIEDLFPHPCIARIRHDTDVIRANNYSKPIVYQQNHEVTKEIRKVISFITGDDENNVPVKKRGIFGRSRK